MTPSVPGSYTGNPGSSPKDEVRFLIGDTNQSAFELSDAEIAYQISLVSGLTPPATGNFLAAAYCAESIAAKYKNLVDKSVGDLHITHSQRQKNYAYISGRLRSRAAITNVPVFYGGSSLTQKIANNSDPDLVSTAVKVDGMDFSSGFSQETDGRSPSE